MQSWYPSPNPEMVQVFKYMYKNAVLLIALQVRLSYLASSPVSGSWIFVQIGETGDEATPTQRGRMSLVKTDLASCNIRRLAVGARPICGYKQLVLIR